MLEEPVAGTASYVADLVYDQLGRIISETRHHETGAKTIIRWGQGGSQSYWSIIDEMDSLGRHYEQHIVWDNQEKSDNYYDQQDLHAWQTLEQRFSQSGAQLYQKLTDDSGSWSDVTWDIYGNTEIWSTERSFDRWNAQISERKVLDNQ